MLKQRVGPLLELRKSESDAIKRKVYKDILVSIYGTLGFKLSPFYNLDCARSITALGRKACCTAESLLRGKIIPHVTDILCANTDSVTFSLDLS